MRPRRRRRLAARPVQRRAGAMPTIPRATGVSRAPRPSLLLVLCAGGSAAATSPSVSAWPRAQRARSWSPRLHSLAALRARR
eukprot:scaffold109699_cov27-Tisochrysis_lutea.AAC.2